MAQSLGNAEDVKRTRDAAESGGESRFLKIPDAKTPWYLLGLEYASYFSHWVEIGGMRRPVVCAGGLEGKGFATDECPICAHTLDLYNEAKELESEGDKDAAGKVRQKANDIRAKLNVVMKAAKGQYVLIKTKTGKKRVADWDMEDSDSNVEVGLLNLSNAQWEGLTGMIGGEDTPFIESGEDLAKRVLWTKKESRKGKTGGKYSAVVWGAEEEEIDFPEEVEVDDELKEIDLDEFAKVNDEDIQKVMKFLTGEDSEDVDDDEEVDLEDDSDDSEIDLDEDDEEDEAPVKKKTRKPAAKKPIKKVVEDDEDDEDPLDDFEDDIPEMDDDEEDEAPVRKTRKSGKRRV
jgi:hypothetical protein